MGIDIVSLCVFCCLLCGGAREIPRLHAPAHPDLLRGFAVNQTYSAGPAPDFPDPLRDLLWTRFFITFLLRPRHNPSPLNPFRKTTSRAPFFSFTSVPTACPASNASTCNIFKTRFRAKPPLIAPLAPNGSAQLLQARFGASAPLAQMRNEPTIRVHPRFHPS